MNSANNHQSLLKVNNLGVTFTDEKGSLQAINDISFSVEREQFICVVGPSGSGKSTLIRVLAGLLSCWQDCYPLPPERFSWMAL